MAYETSEISVLRYSHAGSPAQAYIFKIVVTELNVEGLESDVQFDLLMKTNRSSGTWFTGVAPSLVAKVVLSVNGNDEINVPIGTLSGGSYSFIAYSTYKTIATVTKRIKRNDSGKYLNYCGFKTIQGGGTSAARNYGPQSSNNSTAFEYGTNNKGISIVEVLKNVFAKINGSFVQAKKLFVKVSNSWKEAKQIYVKTNGNWSTK